jgi:hypothetical protein
MWIPIKPAVVTLRKLALDGCPQPRSGPTRAHPIEVHRQALVALTIPTLVNDPRFLPQRDFCLGPAMAGRPVGGDCCLEVVHSGNVLHDAIALVVPDVDPKWEVRLRVHAGGPVTARAYTGWSGM